MGIGVESLSVESNEGLAIASVRAVRSPKRLGMSVARMLLTVAIDARPGERALLLIERVRYEAMVRLDVAYRGAQMTETKCSTCS